MVVKVEAEDADWPPTGKAAQLRYAITSVSLRLINSLDYC